MSDYEIVVADNYCCLAACIEMVCRSEKIYEYSQQDISIYLKARKTESHNAGITISKNTLKKINHYLPKKRIEFIKSNAIDDLFFESLIELFLKEGKHIICLLCSATFTGDSKLKGYGHSILVQQIQKYNVQIIDPGPVKSGIKHMQFPDLFNAIKAKPNGGLLIVS